ncbi:hypothetical protein SK128_003426 [Halocaridina rubra]|uniref:Uncharacterized protein n=1 Tax=Halocaridina rubra TaxID=373956 RepID=A0AAN9ABJ6_HALRR
MNLSAYTRKDMKINTVVKSFKKSGIFNILDGTEDCLWDDMDKEEVEYVLPLTIEGKDEDEEDPYDDIIHPDDFDD